MKNGVHSYIFEDKVAKFLNEIQEYAKRIARSSDVIYGLGVTVQDKTIRFYPGTVPRKRPNF